MKLSRKKLRRMILSEIKKSQRLNEFGISMPKMPSKKDAIAKLLGIIKPLVAKPFNEIGEDGDYWASEILKQAVSSPLMDELSTYELGMMAASATKAATGYPSAAYSATIAAIGDALAFGPAEIVSGDKDLSAIFKDILEILQDHDWA
jgi:hypothetical protein